MVRSAPRKSPTTRGRRHVLLALLLLSGLPALAQWGAQPRCYSIHDTNGDGYLSREEYHMLLELRRTRHPRHRRMTPQPAPAFEEVDRDGDGRIGEAELTDMLNYKMYRDRQKGQRWRGGAN